MKDDVHLSISQAAKLLDKSLLQMFELVRQGKFIPPAGFCDNSGTPFWSAKAVVEWENQHTPNVQAPTARESTEKDPIPLLYVAGPYRADTREGIELNIQSARAVAVRAAKKGWAVICPHLNTAHMDELAPELDDQFWLDATMEMMRRCDAVVLVQGWSESNGSCAEIEEAERLDMDVYSSIDRLEPASEFIDRVWNCDGC